MREISETKVWFLYSLTILLHPSYTDQEKKKKKRIHTINIRNEWGNIITGPTDSIKRWICNLKSFHNTKQEQQQQQKTSIPSVHQVNSI